jgi:hypothetical protein
MISNSSGYSNLWLTTSPLIGHCLAEQTVRRSSSGPSSSWSKHEPPRSGWTDAARCSRRNGCRMPKLCRLVLRWSEGCAQKSNCNLGPEASLVSGLTQIGPWVKRQPYHSNSECGSGSKAMIQQILYDFGNSGAIRSQLMAPGGCHKLPIRSGRSPWRESTS